MKGSSKTLSRMLRRVVLLLLLALIMSPVQSRKLGNAHPQTGISLWFPRFQLLSWRIFWVLRWKSCGILGWNSCFLYLIFHLRWGYSGVGKLFFEVLEMDHDGPCAHFIKAFGFQHPNSCQKNMENISFSLCFGPWSTGPKSNKYLARWTFTGC